MYPLWLSIEPLLPYTRLMLSQPSLGAVLKARLPSSPEHPRAVAMLVEALAAWYGRALTAVLDVDAEEVQRCPERWARLLGDLESPQISVEWTSCPGLSSSMRDRFLGPMGDFSKAKRLLTFAATGQR